MCEKKHAPLLFRRSAPDSAAQASAPRGLEPLDARCERSAWQRNSASQFVNHLIETHHPHLEKRLRRVERSIVNVAASHGLAHGHTWQLAKMFVDLGELLRRALESEIRILSPVLDDSGFYETHLEELEEYSIDRHLDHEAILALFDEIDSLATADVSVEPCHVYRTMLDEIAALEKDYQAHWMEQQSHAELLQHT